MILLDSNIIIYAAQPAYHKLRNWLEDQVLVVSELSRLEVMGYHLIKKKEEKYFGRFFDEINVIPISTEIINTAIPIRKTYNMSLGDSIIAATATCYSFALCTNNLKDFMPVEKLRLTDISNLIEKKS